MSDSPAFDGAACAATVTKALQLPAGSELVVGSLRSIPGARATSRRSTLSAGPAIASVQLGPWRYQSAPDGRLEIGHVVDGVVLSEHAAAPREGGAHVAMAIGQLLADRGPAILPDVLAVLEGLVVASS